MIADLQILDILPGGKLGLAMLMRCTTDLQRVQCEVLKQDARFPLLVSYLIVPNIQMTFRYTVNHNGQALTCKRVHLHRKIEYFGFIIFIYDIKTLALLAYAKIQHIGQDCLQNIPLNIVKK